MMKHCKRLAISMAILSIGMSAGMSAPAFADDLGFWDKTKELVDKLEPRGGAWWNVESNTWGAWTGAKIASFKDAEFVLGYAPDKAVLGAVETDVLAALSRIPGASLQVSWLKLSVGLGAGLNWDSDGGPDMVYGPVFDASVKW